MKFQKIRLNWKVVLEYDWMLVIDKMQHLVNYHEKTMHAQIPITWNNLEKVSEGKAHISTTLGSLIHIKADNKKSLVELTAEVSDEIFNAKAKALIDCGKIYINKNGGFFPHSENIEVLEEMEVDSKNIIFPSYSDKDIKVIQWPNGTHWYAYVGDFQVEDRNGINKWNTKKEANDQAKSHVYKLNREQYKIKE